MGDDLARVREALQAQTQSEALEPRLLERGEVTPVALPPWALDPERGDCTTLVLLAPAPTQFVAHVHPWPDLPHTFPSSAGAFQLTRCGRDRVSLLRVLVEMRSPRAVLHSLVAIGAAAPAALITTLPRRDAGAAAPPGEPGPAPAREALPQRMLRFEQAMRRDGALSVETRSVPGIGAMRLSLTPGCHELYVSQDEPAAYRLELREFEPEAPEQLIASDLGDARREICTARERSLWISVAASGSDGPRQLAAARFALPERLPERFGPAVAERLAHALGGKHAPRRLGPLVATALGAQGRTPLPRQLLPRSCYLAAAVALHGEARALSLGAQTGPWHVEASSSAGQPGPRVAFCTGKSGQAQLDVEARGLGLAWLFFLFRTGPAQPEEP